ncbi:hypothetical protein DFH09DRAFT_1317791 [Mycena vulgaris]|nr:hypothetical protein DFH09DRAFT_1317791 [Mycena vulgaris]
MKEPLTSGKLTQFHGADPIFLMEQLIFGAFNSDCNVCTKAAVGLYNKLFLALNGTASVGNLHQLTANADATSVTINTIHVGISHSAVDVAFGNGVGVPAFPTVSTILLTVLVFMTLP